MMTRAKRREVLEIASFTIIGLLGFGLTVYALTQVVVR